MKQKKIYTVATAHLDTIWNWSYETTIAQYLPKTLAKNFELFEKYPDYRFNFEGSRRYELMKEYYPDQFDTLKDHVAAGRWNVCGSAYENGDVNIPSPEALFRNFLYGNGFFEKTFGKRSKDVFLPDCFGFGAALPAIAKHSGLLGFTTQKLTWGSAFGVPFDLGRWVGVDGSEILASLNMHNYFYTFTRLRSWPFLQNKLKENEKYGLDMTAVFHGVGDRGGAPMERSVQVMENEIKDNRVYHEQILSAAADDMFRDLEADPAVRSKLPVFKNELLMTNHGAGCYTARAQSKRWNAKNETLAILAEKASSAAMLLGAEPYNQPMLEQAWKRVIGHQFHDDLTGTSIQTEYLRSWNDYAISLNQFQDVFEDASKAVIKQLDTSFCAGQPLAVFGAADLPQTRVVSLPMPKGYDCVRVFDPSGAEVPSQAYLAPDGKPMLAFEADLPACGWRVYDLRKAKVPFRDQGGVAVNERTMENEKLLIKLNDNGEVCSIFDKSLGRELLSAPIAAQFLACNGSAAYPAWELRYHEVSAEPQEGVWKTKLQVVCAGPCIGVIAVEYRRGATVLSTVITLRRGSGMLEFRNDLDWHERAAMLKHRFSFTAENDKARYDLGLGSILRGSNTPKRYEVPAQNWAAITDASGSFGVGVISDARRGWDKPDLRTLRLTGVFTPKENFRTDSMQSMLDLGRHTWSFAVFAFENDAFHLLDQQAHAFICPPAVFTCRKHEGKLSSAFSLYQLDRNTVCVRAVKKAEDSDELVVRVNEISGKVQTGVKLRFAFPIASIRKINASEEVIGPIEPQDGALCFDLSAFTVRTFALTLCANDMQLLDSKPVSLPFNAMVFASGQRALSANLPGSCNALPVSAVPAELQTGELRFALQTDPYKNNALVCAGQSIKIPAGAKRFVFLGASLGGANSYRFTADQISIRVPVPAINARLGSGDLPDLEESAFFRRAHAALAVEHTVSPDGPNIADQKLFFCCSVPVCGAETLVLPKGGDLLILSAVFQSEENEGACLTPLEEPFAKRAVFRSDYVESDMSYLFGKLKSFWRNAF